MTPTDDVALPELTAEQKERCRKILSSDWEPQYGDLYQCMREGIAIGLAERARASERSTAYEDGYNEGYRVACVERSTAERALEAALKRAHHLILHIEDVLPDESFDLIDTIRWNAATSDMQPKAPPRSTAEPVTCLKCGRRQLTDAEYNEAEASPK